MSRPNPNEHNSEAHKCGECPARAFGCPVRCPETDTHRSKAQVLDWLMDLGLAESVAMTVAEEVGTWLQEADSLFPVMGANAARGVPGDVITPWDWATVMDMARSCSVEDLPSAIPEALSEWSTGKVIEWQGVNGQVTTTFPEGGETMAEAKERISNPLAGLADLLDGMTPPGEVN